MSSSTLILMANIATSTSLAGQVATVLNGGFFSLVYTILPLAIGVLIFLIGLRWAYRALSGR